MSGDYLLAAPLILSLSPPLLSPCIDLSRNKHLGLIKGFRGWPPLCLHSDQATHLLTVARSESHVSSNQVKTPSLLPCHPAVLPTGGCSLVPPSPTGLHGTHSLSPGGAGAMGQAVSPHREGQQGNRGEGALGCSAAGGWLQESGVQRGFQSLGWHWRCSGRQQHAEPGSRRRRLCDRECAVQCGAVR